LVTTDGSDRDVDRLIKAFPRGVRAEIAQAVHGMPPPGLRPVSSIASSYRRHFSISIKGEQVDIPYRIYNREPKPSPELQSLSPLQTAALDCLYTRHHDGFVRQQRLKDVLRLEEPWAVPFVISLVGEYVVEILADIRRSLTALDEAGSRERATYGGFVAENPEFFDLIGQRVVSYWNCYYRGVYARSEYPGFSLLSSLSAAAAEASAM
jgi:hypothetical protein